MRNILITLLIINVSLYARAQKKIQLASPDGKLVVVVSLNNQINFQVMHQADTILKPSTIGMTLVNGLSWGRGAKLKSVVNRTHRQIIQSPFYKRSNIEDYYNELVMSFKENFDLVFRAYDEGMAYRFIYTGKKSILVENEEADFNFSKDFEAFVPYVKGKYKDIESQYFNSFENEYSHTTLQKMSKDKLAFSPLVVGVDNGKKVCLAEADLESYPGMFLINDDASNSIKGKFAKYPNETLQGGHNELQQMVKQREDYIARSQSQAKYPWRIVIVAEKDKQLADNDMVYKLAAASRLKDVSWIKPGKVAWEWWNHWGLAHVDFQAGVNTATYRAYIDFASKNGIAYVILDEGWAVEKQADLFQVVPEIDLKQLIDYAKVKNVGIILWAGYYAFERNLEQVCKKYSEMGVKGFKVDFMDRDDQQMVDFHYRAAETAARYKLMLDFHGTYKPTGLNRTYPNVINFEAVHGLEQMKWTGPELDQVTYDVTMPFIRMVAGPVDYTQGAMRNATKRTHRGINDEPMSQGTRCRQLAQYVVFESPLNMLCDSPTNYEKEQESTGFIASVPTVWDQSIALDGAIGKFIAIARKNGDKWYVGGMTNWDARELELDLSFLGEGNYVAELYRDGANAGRIASDYKKETVELAADRKIKLFMASGGGFAMKITKK